MTGLSIPERVTARALRNVAVGDNGCLLSLYSVGSHGYAQIGWWAGEKNRMVLCHRVAWIKVHGPIPDGMTVDHLCRVRRCINVEHLRLLTNLENARRNAAGRDWPLGQCINGHDDATNWRPRSERTKGHCLACHREANRRYYRTKRAA